VVFVGFMVGFVGVLCMGNYFRAKRAMERQRQRRMARQSLHKANSRGMTTTALYHPDDSGDGADRGDAVSPERGGGRRQQNGSETSTSSSSPRSAATSGGSTELTDEHLYLLHGHGSKNATIPELPRRRMENTGNNNNYYDGHRQEQHQQQPGYNIMSV